MKPEFAKIVKTKAFKEGVEIGYKIGYAEGKASMK